MSINDKQITMQKLLDIKAKIEKFKPAGPSSYRVNAIAEFEYAAKKHAGITFSDADKSTTFHGLKIVSDTGVPSGHMFAMDGNEIIAIHNLFEGTSYSIARDALKFDPLATPTPTATSTEGDA